MTYKRKRTENQEEKFKNNTASFFGVKKKRKPR